MSVSTQHPEYTNIADTWRTLRDCYEGEDAIKAARERYLPPTGGQLLDGALSQPTSDGHKAYLAYLQRAVFPDSFREGVESPLGVMHRKPAIIRAPDKMRPFLKRLTRDGEDVQLLLRKINSEQLTVGRVGLLLDMPSGMRSRAVPYITIFQAEQLINWDTDPVVGPNGERRLTLAVLDESRYARGTDFVWEWKQQHRALALENGRYVQTQYVAGEQTGKTEIRVNGSTLDYLPFCIVNTKDYTASVDAPPLQGLASMCLTIYRGEADLRQTLFLSGQDTLCIPGGDESKKYRLGAGRVLCTPPGQPLPQFVGISGVGLEAQMKTLEADKSAANFKAGQLTDTTSRRKESGDSLRVRVAAQTATLHQMALTAAACLTRVLQMAAAWMGYSQDEIDGIAVVPNLDFSAEVTKGSDLVDLMTAKSLGAPLAIESIHDVARKGGLTDRTFDEEMELIDTEPPLAVGTDSTGQSSNSNGSSDGSAQP